jgi:hypothetical protein
MRRLLLRAALLAALAGAAPAWGHDERGPDARSGAIAESLLQAGLREQDVAMLFDYLRGAIEAAAEGRDPGPPPPELRERAEALGAELKARGTLAALLALSTLEQELKALARRAPPAERPRLPPTVPYMPVSGR